MDRPRNINSANRATPTNSPFAVWMCVRLVKSRPKTFPIKAVEKQLQAKFLKLLEHMRQLEMNIPFLEAVEKMPQYAKYLKTLLGKQKEA